MRKSIPIILFIGLILLFSGCGQKGAISLPNMNELRLDRSLTTVKNLKTINSMTEIAIEWTPVTNKNVAGYRIFRSENNKAYKLIKVIPDRFSAHYTDTHLKPNSIYIYKVSLFTKDGRVSLTNTTKPVSTKGRIEPPVIVEAISNLPNRIKILWRAHPDPTVKAYIIEKREVGKREYKRIAILRNRLSVEYIDKAVIPQKEYEYRIRAKTFEGVVSSPSEVVRAHAKALPATISRINATTNMPKQIQITWIDPNPVDRIDHYNIYSSAFKDGLYTFLASVKDKKYIDKINKDGVIRYYQVTAVDFDNLESPKGVVVAKGKTMGYGDGPIINSAVIRHNAVILTWTPPKENIKSYTIIKKYWDGWRLKKIKIVDFKSDGNPVRFIDKKIKPNTKYTYYVIGVNSLGIPTEPSSAIAIEVKELQ